MTSASSALFLPSGTYYGETLRRREVAGLSLIESRIAADTVLGTHCHENAYLCFVLAGHFAERSRGAVRSCEPATLKFHPSGQEHSERFGPRGARLFRLELGPAWGDRMGLAAGGLGEDGMPPLQATARRLYGEFRRNDRFAPLAIEGLTLELMATALREAAGSQRRTRAVSRARELLDERPSRPPSLAELARVCGVQPAYLLQRFRLEVGTTPAEYGRRVRIDAAARALAAGSASIAAIAHDNGFTDQSHLTRVFRAVLGMTPAAYRRAIRGSVSDQDEELYKTAPPGTS